MGNSRICHRLLFHEHGKQYFVLLRLHTRFNCTSQGCRQVLRSVGGEGLSLYGPPEAIYTDGQAQLDVGGEILRAQNALQNFGPS